jgi:hypothetical protein
MKNQTTVLNNRIFRGENQPAGKKIEQNRGKSSGSEGSTATENPTICRWFALWS